MDQDSLIKCPTCGEYFPAVDAVKEKYCSWTCISRYLKCINCGKYYLFQKGHDNEYCSGACFEVFQRETKY